MTKVVLVKLFAVLELGPEGFVGFAGILMLALEGVAELAKLDSTFAELGLCQEGSLAYTGGVELAGVVAELKDGS